MNDGFSVVIVNFNSPKLIRSCLESIYNNFKSTNFEVLIVDNNSTEEELVCLQSDFSFVRVIYLHENFGFGFANNVGVKNCKFDTILLLNSDAEFIDNSILTTVSAFHRCCNNELWTLRLVWPDRKFQNSFSKEILLSSFILNYTPIGYLFNKSNAYLSHKYNLTDPDSKFEVDVAYGTALLVSKSNFIALGGFSNKYFMYFEDVDLCDKLRKNNIKIYFQPSTTVVHKVQGGRKNRLNINYLKSKYIYAIDKFGFFAGAILIFIDLPLIILKMFVMQCNGKRV